LAPVSVRGESGQQLPGSTGQGWDAYGTASAIPWPVRLLPRSSDFVFASMLRQDPVSSRKSHTSLFAPSNIPRYGSWSRAMTRHTYSIPRALLGPFAAEALSQFLPSPPEQTAPHHGGYGSDLAWRFAANIFKGYWPTPLSATNASAKGNVESRRSLALTYRTAMLRYAPFCFRVPCLR